jgi:RNA-binding protein Nova
MQQHSENDVDVSGGGRKVAIKFLISNSYAGSLIGKAGKAIKELIAVSEARVNVSGNQELFPGTSDRVVLVAGTQDSVSLAQTLIWEMIAQNVKATAEDRKTLEWSPEAVVNSLGTNDSIQVASKITIPAAAGGLILGKGGETIRSIAAESGSKVLMTSKDDALFTQERVLTISGEAGQCVKCVDLILAKLAEQDDIPMFVNRGTTYSPAIRGSFFSMPMGQRGPPRGGKQMNAPMTDRRGQGVDLSNTTSEVDATQTNITISIPNEYVGNIFGRQGSTMREIISLSGAKVNVSGRNEFVEGTNNRLVTITGSPQCAQAAHLFITQRLETPANPPPRKPRN